MFSSHFPPELSMSRQAAAGFLVALALVLIGCAAGGGRWIKPGADDATVSVDLGACRAEAREAARRDNAIDSDILASRGTDWQHGGTLGLVEDEMASARASRGDAVLARCMATRGYRRAS